MAPNFYSSGTSHADIFRSAFVQSMGTYVSQLAHHFVDAFREECEEAARRKPSWTNIRPEPVTPVLLSKARRPAMPSRPERRGLR